MKKIMIFAALCGVVLLAQLVGCTGKKAETKELSDITCQLITDTSGIDDKSFNAAAWRGILEYYGDTWENAAGRGTLYNVVNCPSQDQYNSIVQQATDEGYDLIIATGFTFADTIQSIGEKNPEQKYLIVDVSWVNLQNVLNVDFAEHEGSYLVGVAAAQKAIEDGIKDPRFGFIGGVSDPTITKFEVGYIQGILSVLPKAGIIDYYVGSWADPDKAKAQAKNWFDSGVFIIYSAAGSSGNGAIAQAKEYRSQGKNVWAIGVDSDQYEEGIYSGTDSAVYTSMLKRVEIAAVYALSAVKDGTFSGGVRTLDLKSDGVGYARTNPAMSNEIKVKIDEIADKIKSGGIYIAPTYAEAKKIEGFPQDLQAVD